ncbi:MAG: Mfa1 family fimbria major subunit [Bacteroidales bacterium]|nr:Mfa1 family fimbria major subunit [Bacteroidales bacterium]
MKSWSKILIGLSVLALLMAGCKPDEKNDKTGNGEPGGETEESVVYMAVNVSLPPASGAAAKDGSANLKPDGETGKDYENNVANMLIVLATYPENNFITYGTVMNPTAVTAGTNAGTVKAVSSVNRAGLDAYYASADVTNRGQVYVYVFCNYTEPLLKAITGLSGRVGESGGDSKATADWLHEVADITAVGNEGIWRKGEFLMSNVAKAQRTIPNDLRAWQMNYAKDESTAFNLSGTNTTGEDNSGSGKGAIRVHRSMARFDLKDGSVNGDRKYVIATKGTGNGDLTVELVRMALVNQSKRFYYLQHVTDKDKNITSVEDVLKAENQVVCGEEFYDFADGGKHTYVVDADADQPHKKAHQSGDHIDPATLSDHFKHTLFDNTGAITTSTRSHWQSSDIAEVLRNAEGSDYAIWTYTTENAVPHTDQRVGVTTGIVFKGKLGYTDGTNETLKKAIDGEYGAGSENNYVKELEVNGTKKSYPILYTFGENADRRLYVGWNDQVKTAVDAGYADVKGSIAYAAKTKNYPSENPQYSQDELFQTLVAKKGAADEAAALADFKKSATMAGFTLYEASNDEDGGMESAEGSREPHGPGYYCYYYYWNRHNADNIFGTMSPMEFAVVRNNVYKLSVKSIQRFGHPRITENDPDPLTPDTPCEKDDLYMSVDIEVAPWVVRENVIEF